MKWNDSLHCARQLAGNWMKFNSFAWRRLYDLDRPQDWVIVYTHHRDSGLLDQSNAKIIAEALAPFLEEEEPTVMSERHDHWGHGWVAGYAILAFKDGELTEAWKTYCELMDRMSDYPVLDEEDYSQRESEATLENIEEAGRGLVRESAPEEWVSLVYSWFWSHNQSAITNRDDRGGCPSDEEMRECLLALHLLDEDEMSEEEMEEEQKWREAQDAPGQTTFNFPSAQKG